MIEQCDAGCYWLEFTRFAFRRFLEEYTRLQEHSGCYLIWSVSDSSPRASPSHTHRTAWPLAIGIHSSHGTGIANLLILFAHALVWGTSVNEGYELVYDYPPKNLQQFMSEYISNQWHTSDILRPKLIFIKSLTTDNLWNSGGTF